MNAFGVPIGQAAPGRGRGAPQQQARQSSDAGAPPSLRLTEWAQVGVQVPTDRRYRLEVSHRCRTIFLPVLVTLVRHRQAALEVISTIAIRCARLTLLALPCTLTLAQDLQAGTSAPTADTLDYGLDAPEEAPKPSRDHAESGHRERRRRRSRRSSEEGEANDDMSVDEPSRSSRRSGGSSRRDRDDRRRESDRKESSRCVGRLCVCFPQRLMSAQQTKTRQRR